MQPRPIATSSGRFGGTFGSMRRQCARPGCSVVATATFTFDSLEKIIYLDGPADADARAGELCERHVRGLTPPLGWSLRDRRARQEPVMTAQPVAEPRPTPPPEPVLAPRPEPDLAPMPEPVLAPRPEPAPAFVPAQQPPHQPVLTPRTEPAFSMPAEPRREPAFASAAVQSDPVVAVPQPWQLHDELADILNANTPLLSRAFRSAGIR